MDGGDWTRFGPDDYRWQRILVDRKGRVLLIDGKRWALISLGRGGDDAPAVVLPLPGGMSHLTLDEDAPSFPTETIGR